MLYLGHEAYESGHCPLLSDFFSDNAGPSDRSALH